MANGKCIIVCPDKDKKWANYLLGLIGSSEDYEAAIWTESVYASNAPTLSSHSKIVFIGGMNEAKAVASSIEWTQDKGDLKYGWLGNRAVIQADQWAIGVKNSQAAVKEQATNIKIKLASAQDLAANILKNKEPKALRLIKAREANETEIVDPIVTQDTATTTELTIDTPPEKEGTYSEQLKSLIKEFYENDFASFMGNNK
jgi:hypothetical protein